MAEKYRFLPLWIAFGTLITAVTIYLTWGLATQAAIGNVTAPFEACLDQAGTALRECYQAAGDLQAQQTMATFTMVMGVTAIVGTILGVASIFLIYQTLAETRQAAAITREVGQSQVRAYLSLSYMRVSWKTQPHGEIGVHIEVEYKNNGNSPAKEIRLVQVSQYPELSQSDISYSGDISAADVSGRIGNTHVPRKDAIRKLEVNYGLTIYVFCFYKTVFMTGDEFAYEATSLTVYAHKDNEVTPRWETSPLMLPKEKLDALASLAYQKKLIRDVSV